MKERMKSTFFLVGVLIALLLIMGSQDAMAQHVTGAIFTTDEYSNFVNNNLYERKEKVYLNGGPRPNAPCTAAGLPDGEYYFQVTDPSGNTLLSAYGHQNGTITVSDGVISYYSGSHVIGSGQCGDITVQLYPYGPTPNQGNEYKVWITNVKYYDSTHSTGSFGFIHSKSKTDNFKVVSLVDSDVDGVPDADDNCPTSPNDQTDTDGDGVGDACDAFPDNPDESVDSDSDDIGDNSDVCPFDPTDNCPEAPL